MEKKKGFLILKPVIVVLFFILIILTLIVNILFSKNKTPNIFGRYIYVVSGTEMQNEVTDGAALIAMKSDGLTIEEGDVVLCKLSGENEIKLRSIYKIAKDEETGQDCYYPATDLEQGVELSIPRENIVALCTGYSESFELGQYINFTTNIKGIVVQLIIPCVLLVIMLICSIAKNRDEDAEDYNFYSYEDENAQENSKAPSPSAKPLFNPEEDPIGNNELERKKMSIAENFSQKEVNPDSPYQKEKERTMQFKAQRSSSTESSFAARNMGGQSSTAPTADALREEILRRTAESERNSVSTPADKDDNDNTVIISTADVSRTEPLKKHTSTAARSYTPKKSSSPDIDDIIKKSSPSKSKSISAMSVDDLLKVIEEEKKKL